MCPAHFEYEPNAAGMEEWPRGTCALSSFRLLNAGLAGSSMTSLSLPRCDAADEWSPELPLSEACASAFAFAFAAAAFAFAAASMIGLLVSSSSMKFDFKVFSILPEVPENGPMVLGGVQERALKEFLL